MPEMSDELRKAEQRELAALRERDAALARIRSLEVGLAWYADQDNYLGHCPVALDDLGARARAALAGPAEDRPGGAGERG